MQRTEYAAGAHAPLHQLSASADVGADVKVSLALCRATLHALAMSSPALHRAADAAIEQGAERARRGRSPQAQGVIETLEEARAELRAAVAELQQVEALERALMDAADALADDREVMSEEILAAVR